MRSFRLITPAIIFCMLLSGYTALAQDQTWSSETRIINIKGYEGHRFKLQARVKAEPGDDGAAAHIWARVDLPKGNGFFENMQDRPVRDHEWKTYTIEGTIDKDATQLAVGEWVILNGKFYFDDFIVQAEAENNKWVTLFSADFENGKNELSAGIGIKDNGVNPLYKTSVQKDGDTKNMVLAVVGNEIPNYGDNKKAGNYANVNGIKLYYEIYGQGPPLVVLHGNGGSIEDAALFYKDLAKEYKVIAIDSRGQGRSTDGKQPLNYDMMASDVNALLDQLHIDSAFVWGHSDGGILALLLAIDYPKKVKRALAGGANLEPDSSAVFGWAVTAVNRVIATSKDPKKVELYTMMRDYPHISLERLHGIKAPVLVMGGDRDVIRPEHLVKIFQNIPNSQLCILPGATHGGAWEDKERFMHILEKFFNTPFTMPDTADWFKE